jgi:toxin ParE1/3/4
MSCPERTVTLSPAAQADFTDIVLYTWQQWGEEQRDRYQAMLEQAMPVSPIFPRQVSGCRASVKGAALAAPGATFSTTESWTIRSRVVRILHERSGPTRHFHSGM